MQEAQRRTLESQVTLFSADLGNFTAAALAGGAGGTDLSSRLVIPFSEGGNGLVTLVVERVVADDEPLPFDDEPVEPALEPLRDVILRDLQRKDEPAESPEEQRGVGQRARSFFGVDEDDDEDQGTYW